MAAARTKWDPRNSMIAALEAIIESDLPDEIKTVELKKYEKVLARRSGITLRTWNEVKNVARKKSVNGIIRAKDLKALENLYLGGAEATHREMGKRFDKRFWKKVFRTYVANILKVEHRRRMRKQALLEIKAQRVKERAVGKKVTPWRPRPK